MNCPECNQRMIIKKVPYIYKNQSYLGDFEAELCERCKIIYFSEESFRQIKKRARELGIWGRNMIIPSEKMTASLSKRNISIVDPITIFYSRPSPILTINNTRSVI